MTPTNYVWPASQDRVPSVWCCLTPHRLVNEGASWGRKGGVGWWKGEGAVLKEGGGRGWRRPPSLLLLLRSVPDQLLIHSSFTKTTNGGHTRAQAGQDVGSSAPSCPPPSGSFSTPLLQKQSGSSPSLLFLPLSVARRLRLLALRYPVTPPPPIPIPLVSPAPLEQIGSCLRLVLEQVRELRYKWPLQPLQPLIWLLMQRRTPASPQPFGLFS